MATISLTKVKLNEYLFIERHKLKINQTKMANRFGITRHLYSEIELGLKLIGILPGWRNLLIPIKLTEIEKCIILRRRAGLTHTQLSGKIGISRTWLCLMETGRRNPARLIEYWSS